MPTLGILKLFVEDFVEAHKLQFVHIIKRNITYMIRYRATNLDVGKFFSFNANLYFAQKVQNKIYQQFIDMLLGEKLKELREAVKQPQRRVAAALDIDTATYCKIEKGKYFPNREIVLQLSYFLKYDSEELIKLWLADRLMDVAKDEDMAPEAMRLATDLINDKTEK